MNKLSHNEFLSEIFDNLYCLCRLSNVNKFW